jgi:hypothetical protein
MDIVRLREGLERRSCIGADTQDLGVDGFELRQGRIEAQDFPRSGASERLDEGEDNHWALAQQLGQLDRLSVWSLQGEVRRLLPDLEGSGVRRQQQADRCTGQNSQNPSPLASHSPLPS